MVLQLAYCVVQFLEKDPGLTDNVSVGIGWPGSEAVWGGGGGGGGGH